MDTNEHEWGGTSRSALKGRDVIAQGEALGVNVFSHPALKGRHKRATVVSPLQGLKFIRISKPRALPWAITGRPFRPQNFPSPFR